MFGVWPRHHADLNVSENIAQRGESDSCTGISDFRSLQASRTVLPRGEDVKRDEATIRIDTLLKLELFTHF